MSLADDWQLLGIAPTDDRREVKRAYSRVLKGIDVDADPTSFMRLRQALENALQWGVDAPWWEDDGDEASTSSLTDEGPEVESEADAVDWEDEEPWDESPLQWRMAPPISEGELGSLMSELDQLLFQQEPDPGRIAQLGDKILRGEDLEHVDTASLTEEWLAETIVAAIPASDPLIDPAIKRFGWDRGHDSSIGYAVQAVLERAADRKKLATIADPSHPHHRALQELRGPGRTHVSLFQQPLVDDVADLLSFIRTWHPTLEKDLAGPNLDWWQNYISYRPLPRNFWALMLAGSLLFFAAGAVLRPGAAIDAVVLLVVLASMPLCYALIRSAMALRAVARRRHEQEGPWDQYKYLPQLSGAIFCSPLIFAGVPSGNLPLTLSVLISAALGVTAYLRLAAPEWDDASSRWGRRFMPIGAGIVSGFALAEMPSDVALQLIAPLALCCWFGDRGWHSWTLFLEDASLPKRWMLDGLVVAMLTVAAGTAIAGLSSDPSPMLLVSVPLAVLLQHLVLAYSLVYLPWLEWPLRTATVLFIISLPAFRVSYGEGLNRFTLGVMLYLLVFSLVKFGTFVIRRMQPLVG